MAKVSLFIGDDGKNTYSRISSAMCASQRLWLNKTSAEAAVRPSFALPQSTTVEEVLDRRAELKRRAAPSAEFMRRSIELSAWLNPCLAANENSPMPQRAAA